MAFINSLFLKVPNLIKAIPKHSIQKKIALCVLRWFKLNVSKYQKDVKLSKRCQVVKKMSNVKK